MFQVWILAICPNIWKLLNQLQEYCHLSLIPVHYFNNQMTVHLVKMDNSSSQYLVSCT